VAVHRPGRPALWRQLGKMTKATICRACCSRYSAS
jgi:hypothetical protein